MLKLILLAGFLWAFCNILAPTFLPQGISQYIPMFSVFPCIGIAAVLMIALSK